jgi:serine/threonine protein kinase
MSINDFVTIAKIGEGAYSSVHKAKRISDGIVYALKKVILSSYRLKSAILMKNKSKMHSTRFDC